MIDQGIVDLLANDSGVAAILKTSTVAQLTGWTAQASIYQVVAPEDLERLPLIAFSYVGGSSGNTLDGVGGIQKLRLQIDCWGTTPVDAKNLADAVRKVLDGYQGVLSDGTWLQSAVMVHPGIDFFSDASRYYRRMLEFYLLYNFTS